jgi:hypothetical protein
MSESKPLLVRIPPELHARVKDYAEVHSSSMAQVTIAALKAYLDASYMLISVVEEESGERAGQFVVRVPDGELEKLWRQHELPDS